MVRLNRITNKLVIEPGRRFSHLPSESWARARCETIPAAARVFVLAILLCLGIAHGWAQQRGQPPARPKGQQETPQKDQQQMRGLDEQIQEVKSDILRIAAELNQLEEKLLYPSGTQVAIFVAMAKGDKMRLDAVRLQIDGQLVAHYIYSAKELRPCARAACNGSTSATWRPGITSSRCLSTASSRAARTSAARNGLPSAKK